MKKSVSMPLIAVMVIAKASNAGLAVGDHVVTIESITAKESKEKDDWKDQTPQLEITFVTASGGKMKHWYNLVGFTKYEDLTDAQKKSKKFRAAGDEGYAVTIATGKRVISDENTEKALAIIGALALHSGISKDAEVDTDELVGRTVGITVFKNEQGNARVKNTFMPAEVKEALDQEA